MGAEHRAAVWEHSRQIGSGLVVLLAVAEHCDPTGEWVIDQATLQLHTRLSNRRVRQILAELIAAGELAVVSHHGRGKLSIYRLLVGREKWKPVTAPAQKEEAGSRFPSEKVAGGSRIYSDKPATASQFPAPLVPLSPHTPQSPLIPLKSKSRRPSVSGPSRGCKGRSFE